VKGCADTFSVTVNCSFVNDSTIFVNVPEGETLVICLEDYGYDPAVIDTVTSNCPDGLSATVTLDPLTLCVTILADTLGQDTACFTVTVGDSTGVFTIIMNVTPPCPRMVPGGVLAAQALHWAVDALRLRQFFHIALLDLAEQRFAGRVRGADMDSERNGLHRYVRLAAGTGAFDEHLGPFW
jgi:hypothetical protein